MCYQDKNNDIQTILFANHIKKLLEENIREIRSVDDWANKAGVSRRWLYRCLKIRFNITPSKMLREVRYKKIQTLINVDPDATAMFVANSVAMHWSDKKSLQFLIKTLQHNVY
ncbi:hypothetical protein BH23THE1_BH23THE1_14770 [soil metagenome]